jgi:hypothetical protein
MRRRSFLCFTSAIFIGMSTIMFSGCEDTKKIITLSEDKLIDDIAEERKATRLTRFKDITAEVLGTPLSWIDDDNVAVIYDKNATSSEIYNLNISSGEMQKVFEIKGLDRITSSVVTFNQAESFINIMYVKESKIWTYNIMYNTTKVIYDLKKTSNETGNLNGNEALEDRFNCKYVMGSNKYAWIQIPDYRWLLPGRIIRIIDMEKREYIDCPKILNELSDIGSIMYSKYNDSFYGVLSPSIESSGESTIFQFKLGKEDSFKIIKKTAEVISDVAISENGRDIYYTTMQPYEKYNSYIAKDIVKYNVEKESFTTMVTNNNKARYNFINFNYKNNLVYYERYEETSMKRIYSIGYVDGDKIIDIQGIPEKAENGDFPLHGGMIFNSSGSKCITIASGSEDPSIQGPKYVIYEIKN